jgi:hypothetical protein
VPRLLKIFAANSTFDWRSASFIVYIVFTIALTWPASTTLTTHIVSDLGDPLLNAAILHWNAENVPFTQTWWNFPIFFPTDNALTFSETLLGVTVITAPIHWVTNSPLMAYNLLVLLSFPLSAITMYAFVNRVTGVPAAAFLAGLAFGFAPYRVAHLSHVQVLASFWMPLALLGLHAFLETRQRRWLLLFAGSWLLQSTTNGYFFVFFSILVALWISWFVIGQRRWRDLRLILLSVAMAAIPLVPLFYRYQTVHVRHGFSRDLGEVAVYSANVGSLLCAPDNLYFWGWVRTICNPEGVLFPGAALALLITFAVVLRISSTSREPVFELPRWLRLVRRGIALVGAAYLIIAAATLIFGPMQFAVGSVRASASRIDKPLSVVFVCLISFFVSGRVFRDAFRRSSLVTFYAGATVFTWLLALGPFPTLLGRPVLYQAPYLWFRLLPGADGLRAPARWWMLTLLCLTIVVGLLMAALLRGQSRRVVAATVVFVTVGLMSDVWVSHFPTASVSLRSPDPSKLRQNVVLELPVGDPWRDMQSVYRAVAGDWKTINGYSGYEPRYYDVLRAGSVAMDGSILAPFLELTDLQVVVSRNNPGLVSLIARLDGASLVGQDTDNVQYFIRRRTKTSFGLISGASIPIQRIESSCATDLISLVTDGNLHTRWQCGFQESDQYLLVDLGKAAPVASVVHVFGPFAGDFPRILTIETSQDGARWEPAWSGSLLGHVIAASLEDTRGTRVPLPFEPRVARFIRLRQTGRDKQHFWSVAEIEVRSPAARRLN